MALSAVAEVLPLLKGCPKRLKASASPGAPPGVMQVLPSGPQVLGSGGGGRFLHPVLQAFLGSSGTC